MRATITLYEPGCTPRTVEIDVTRVQEQREIERLVDETTGVVVSVEPSKTSVLLIEGLVRNGWKSTS